MHSIVVQDELQIPYIIARRYRRMLVIAMPIHTNAILHDYDTTVCIVLRCRPRSSAIHLQVKGWLRVVEAETEAEAELEAEAEAERVNGLRASASAAASVSVSALGLGRSLSLGLSIGPGLSLGLSRDLGRSRPQPQPRPPASWLRPSACLLQPASRPAIRLRSSACLLQPAGPGQPAGQT